jgi:hypothetical protein
MGSTVNPVSQVWNKMSAGRSSVGAFMSAAIAAGAERLFALPTYDRHDPVAGLLISAQCARVGLCVCVWVGGGGGEERGSNKDSFRTAVAASSSKLRRREPVSSDCRQCPSDTNYD